MKRCMQGFTLVELSLVLLALGLILPGAVMFWQFSERHRVAAVQMDVQQQAHDAVVGFLHANYRLPCPAADREGVESCTTIDAVPRQVGYVPWRTLFLPRPEAGKMLYGVDRKPATTAAPALDQDLAVARDRMNPLRVRTPEPTPANHTEAPNPHAAPIPQWVSGPDKLLGTTQSGNPAAPLNSACNAADQPPCPLGLEGAVNLIDVCLALNTASDALVAPVGRLATQVGNIRRTAAFVIAAPGMLDASGNGQIFDGPNATASTVDPTFAAPGTPVTNLYDDTVLAASHTELFAQLQCGAALSAISHAHFNVATGAFVMERALYDYRDQLYIAVVLAKADKAGADAGVASAVAGALDAAKEMASAVADTTASLGARSVQIGLAGVGIGLAVAGGIAAGLALDDAIESLKEAEGVFADFAQKTSAMTALSRSINTHTLTADAMGH